MSKSNKRKQLDQVELAATADPSMLSVLSSMLAQQPGDMSAATDSAFTSLLATATAVAQQSARVDLKPVEQHIKRRRISKLDHVDGVKVLTCQICGHQVSRSDILTVHMRSHTGEKPYECRYQNCGMRFSTTGSLSRHRRRHVDERPHICNVCDNKFTARSDLVRHMLIHSGERPFPCLECDAKFSTNVQLIAHGRRHSGEKPFACSVIGCELRYATSQGIARHRRNAHSINEPHDHSAEAVAAAAIAAAVAMAGDDKDKPLVQ